MSWGTWWHRKHRGGTPTLTYWSLPRDPKGYRGKCTCETEWRTGHVDRSTCPIHGPRSDGATFEVIR